MNTFRQIRGFLLIIFGVIAGLLGLWSGRFLPGTAGEFFARIFHILTTPIILEISFGALGIMIVFALAHHHEKNADEWVEMDFPQDEEKK
jgi:hypothetical protein